MAERTHFLPALLETNPFQSGLRIAILPPYIGPTAKATRPRSPQRHFGLQNLRDLSLSIPFRYVAKVGSYLLRQQLSGKKRFPLVLMMEPLFRCNLACAGCGKIDYPDEILNRRLSVEDALASVDECGAPVVVLAGGEPLLHKEMAEITRGIIAKKKFVILCTNALLLDKKMDQYEPNPFFTWDVHLDGDKEMHDQAVSQEGVYDRAVAVIAKAKARGSAATPISPTAHARAPAKLEPVRLVN